MVVPSTVAKKHTSGSRGASIRVDTNACFPRLTFSKSHLDDLFLCLLRQNSDELKRFCDCFTAPLGRIFLEAKQPAHSAG